MSLMMLSVAAHVTMATDCHGKRTENLRLAHASGPFPDWHDQCFFVVLDRCKILLAGHGISIAGVEAYLAKHPAILLRAFSDREGCGTNREEFQRR